MSEQDKKLGKIVAIHGVSPVYLQRAVFIAITAFLFFLAMMAAYYIRQSTGYFLLASAFLVLYALTMFSFIAQRRSVVRLHEHGLRYKDRSVLWNEIENINDNSLTIRDARPIVIQKTINDRTKLIAAIQQRIS